MSRNGPQRIDVSINHRMLAQQIYDPGNPLRIVMHGLNGFLREDGLAVRSRNAQSLGNIPVGFLERERGSAAAQRDPLPELAQVWRFQPFLKLRLSRENDLQKFLC